MYDERETACKRGYDAKWRKARRIFLLSNPLCIICHEDGKVERATVVDHIEPHRGNHTLFWDQANWQPLCKHCHDSIKAREEARGYSDECGLDGWPIDEEHPVNAHEKKKKQAKTNA